MIRSSKHSLKFTNKLKQIELIKFVADYRQMTQKYINIIWNTNTTPSLLDNNMCQSINTNIDFDSRIRQCAAKQACSMVKSVLTKQNKRLHKLKQLQKENKNTIYLQRKIAKFKTTKPNANNINVELDPRFINFKEDAKHFDLFIQIHEIGNKRKIRIPIHYTKVSKKWEQQGKLKRSIRLNENSVTLYYEITNKQNNGTKIIGADQGQITCLSLSDNQVTTKNKDGYDLNKIQDILARKVKGSKGFKRTQEHRKNYINWSINQLNFSDVKELRLEKIVNLRKGKVSSRKLSHWTYTLIKSKLVMLSETKGFSFVEQDNKFRSQRCGKCGWTHKSNRKGKTFKCTNTNCNYIADSDLNAASNHEIDLVEVPNWVWHKHLNRSTGFYWLKDKVVCGQECIVPDVKKENKLL